MTQEACPKCAADTTLDRTAFWKQRLGVRIALSLALGLPPIGVLAVTFPTMEKPWDSVVMGVVGGVIAGVAWEAVTRVFFLDRGARVCTKCDWRA